MNKINLYKQIGVFILMVLTMFALAYIDIESYKALMFVIGSGATGYIIGKFVRTNWPLYDKGTK